MTRKNRYFIHLAALLPLLLAACEKLSRGQSGTPAPPSPDEQGNPPVGTVDDSAGFYVRLFKTGTHDYVVHKTATSTAEPCVAKEGESIDCYFEAKELDLFYHGVKLQYNVPTTMCSYLRTFMYWYWKYSAGNGPASVQRDTDKNGAVGVDTNTDGVVDAAETTCQHDHTAIEGPNCCEGEYTLVERAWNAAANNGAGAYDPPKTTPDVKWGGDAAACVGGPALATHKGSDGFPTTIYTYVDGVGLNANYEIAASIGTRFSNIYAANYYDPADHGGGTPVGLQSPGGGLPTPTRHYTFQCVNRANEIKSEIRVIIREWNSVEKYDAMASDITQHSVGGTEPTPWDSYGINDFADWRDFGNIYPQKAE